MQLIKYTIIIFITTGMLSCSSQKPLLQNNDDYVIFQQLIKDRKPQSIYLVKEANNHDLRNLIEEEYPTFFVDWEYNTYQNSISYEVAKEIFNDVEIKNYYKQLEKEYIWAESFSQKLISKDSLSILRDKIRKEKSFDFYWRISKIIYTTNKKYALVLFGYTDIQTESNVEGGLNNYKNEEGIWKFHTQLFYFFQ